jgi:hypothetical protein
MRLHPNGFEACIAKIASQAGVDKKQAQDMLQETAIQAQKLRERGDVDPYGNAVRKLADEQKKAAVKARTDAIRNSMIRKGLMDDIHVNGLKNAALSLESAMVNINTTLPSMKAPLEEVGQGMAFRWLTALNVELGKLGMDKAFASGALDDQIAKELWKLSGIGPKQPPGDNLGRAAYILNRTLYDAGERLKGAGAVFDHAVDYITRTKHDPRLMIDAGFEKWWAQTEPRFHDRTWDSLEYWDKDTQNVLSPAQAKLKFARSVYNGLTTGVHNVHGEGHSVEGDAYIPPAFEGTRNLGKSLSHERVLYWKDSDAWLEHMREFGGMSTLYRTVHETLITASRHAALMERFGTNPMGSLKMLVRQVQEHYRDIDPIKVNEFTAKSEHLMRVMSHLDGSAYMPHSRARTELVNTLKNIESASMLGAVGLTHFSALPMTMSTLGPHYDINRFDLFANNIKALASGYHGLMGNAEIADVLAEAGAFEHGKMVHFWSEFKKSQTIPGRVSAIAAMTLKATGINFVLENSQNGFRTMLMNKIGRELEKPFGEINEQLRNNLTKYQIGEKEWELLKGAMGQMHTIKGERYATPKDFDRLDDAAIDAHVKPQIDAYKQAIEDQRHAHMHADAMEENWLRDRTDKLESRIQNWRDRIDKWSEQRDFRKSEIWLGAESKVEEMKERLKEAKVTQRMAKHVETLKTADEVKAWTDEVRQVMENERQRLGVEGVGDNETEELFHDLAHGEADVAKEKQTGVVAEGATAQEKLATKYGRFLARSERRIRQYHSAAEEKIKAIEGRRLSDVERFEKTGKMKTDKQPAELLGKDEEDTRRFTEMVKDADEAMREFSGRSEARIWQRAERLEGMEQALPNQIDRLRRQTRWQLADNYAAFLAHAGKEATVAAGAREKAWASGYIGTSPMASMFMQFKSWPLAVINQIHGRELYSSLSKTQKAANIGWLLAFSAAGGMFRMMVRDVTNGNPIRDPRDPRTMAAALAQGGGVGLLGDFLFGETNRMGGGLLDTLAGPVMGDANQLAKIFYKTRDDTYAIGDDIHHGKGAYSDIWPDLLHFTKNHIPMANMLGLKGALDYLVWNHLFEAVSPGYWSRTNKRLLKETGRAKVGYYPNMGPPSLF